MHKRKKLLFFTLFIFILLFSSFIFITRSIPSSFSLVKEYESTLEVNLPFSLYFKSGADDNSTSLTINNEEISEEPIRLSLDNPLKIRADDPGVFSLNVKLFGFIPLRTLEVNVLPEVRVMPGGQAIGVLVKSDGVMVVSYSFVERSDGRRVYPARDAGFRPGDIIKEINGEPVLDKSVLGALIREHGADGPLDFTVERRTGYREQLQVEPVLSRNGDYQIGLFVEDAVSGVGTLTFYEPQRKEYGALGHIITEATSQRKIDVLEGKIVEARISGINVGDQGMPGQKQGLFFETNNILGNIKRNTPFGIYGVLEADVNNPFFEEPIPVASISQVEEGTAFLYTVIEEGKIEKFEVELERVFHQTRPDTRGMVLNITDDSLRTETGGIIQGMSGSPIVQNNKLVGAVTHVFVNDPSRGYGVFAEWMLKETDILERETGSTVH